MTHAQATTLRHGDIVHANFATNVDGTPQRWRVTGKVQLWKRSPQRIRVPLKHGLYTYGAITEHTLENFNLPQS